mmetsp:Transcript_9038/g.29929  ORF Transcript_9038/g.29929 Transcript_9038/m.29929 type:complete len:297 (+) Transcript_9038:605-1495(+)
MRSSRPSSRGRPRCRDGWALTRPVGSRPRPSPWRSPSGRRCRSLSLMSARCSPASRRRGPGPGLWTLRRRRRCSSLSLTSVRSGKLSSPPPAPTLASTRSGRPSSPSSSPASRSTPATKRSRRAGGGGPRSPGSWRPSGSLWRRTFSTPATSASSWGSSSWVRCCHTWRRPMCPSCSPRTSCASSPTRSRTRRAFSTPQPSAASTGSASSATGGPRFGSPSYLHCRRAAPRASISSPKQRRWPRFSVTCSRTLLRPTSAGYSPSSAQEEVGTGAGPRVRPRPRPARGAARGAAPRR